MKIDDVFLPGPPTWPIRIWKLLTPRVNHNDEETLEKASMINYEAVKVMSKWKFFVCPH